MKENNNYKKLNAIFKKNNGFITREDVDNASINSWFLTDFVRKKSLIKIAPGYYTNKNFARDELYILQRRYPKYIFSGMTALFLHGLIDRIPQKIEVTKPQNYHPERKKNNNLIINSINDYAKYSFGIVNVKTMFNNIVNCYSKERCICQMIKNRKKYDSEAFTKAIKEYNKSMNNQISLFECAKKLGVEDKVFDVMELIDNEN